ncbi:hypothetical protein DEM91_07920 [Prevotella sp. TCVGH]|uniref:transposase n=1 Tax=Prevotella sp. TCVGH TaxID=2182433 RepID=UPI00201D7E84|nr:hypothetical protein [Prevotella sp. TCVGH]
MNVTLAAALTQTTSGFTYFDKTKQLNHYQRPSPNLSASGTSINFKGHINRNGDSSLRSVLYVTAFSLLRCNTQCRDCYNRLRSNEKPKKVAIIATAQNSSSKFLS